MPTRVLGSEDLDVRLIDTRGVDEPSAPRRDLQAYLDDSRCVIVLCSKFGDAPNAATLAVLEQQLQWLEPLDAQERCLVLDTPEPA